MSAIAARRARLAAVSSASASPSLPAQISSDEEVPNDIPSTPSSSLAGKRAPARIEDDYESIKRHKKGSESDQRDHSHAVRATSTKNSSTEAFLHAQSSFVPQLHAEQRNTWFDRKARKENRQVVCALRQGETMALIGSGYITVLSGVLSLGGANLTKDHQEVLIIAPSNAPLPLAQATGECCDGDLAIAYDFEKVEYAAIVSLRDDHTSDVQEVHRSCPTIARTAFSSDEFASHDWPLSKFGPMSNSTRGLVRAWTPPSWSKALQEVEMLSAHDQGLQCLIRGPKRVGKSTLSKMLVHRLQTSSFDSKKPIAFLECDLGQSDFGLPGTVALHLFYAAARRSSASQSSIVFGPSWATIRHPIKSHFLGEVSPKSAPNAYINAISDLLRLYATKWRSQGVSLIVNTHGWVKGLGADLLMQIEEMVRPTVILDISEDTDSSALGDVPVEESSSNSGFLATTMTLEAAPALLTRERGLNAAEARSMNLLSYFYSVELPRSVSESTKVLSSAPRWDFSSPLVSQRPLIVDVNRGVLGGIHVTNDTCHVTDRLRLAALNGSCVAIVLIRSHDTDDKPATESAWLTALNAPMPSIAASTCLGFAIVRSIDPERAKLHLLTPLSASQVTDAKEQEMDGATRTRIALVKGSIDVPIWLSLDGPTLEAVRENNVSASDPTHLANVPLAEVPYLDFGSAADDTIVGMKKRRVRRNLLRPSQR